MILLQVCRDALDVKVVFPFAEGKVAELIVPMLTTDRGALVCSVASALTKHALCIARLQ